MAADPTSSDKDSGAKRRAPPASGAPVRISLRVRVDVSPSCAAVLQALEHDLGSGRLRDDLRRRVHALSAGARLLRFSGMAAALAEVERIARTRSCGRGSRKPEVPAISRAASKACRRWLGTSRPTSARSASAPRPRPSARQAAIPPTVLVVGPVGPRGRDHPFDRPHGRKRPRMRADRTFLLRRSTWRARWLPMWRSSMPISPGVKELVEQLAQDPLTEQMPLLVVGTWSSPEEGAKWIALGARG